MLIYILYFFILSDCSELRSVFLVGFLAWFFEECAQRGFLIPIYSEEFSAIPDGRKHDRHRRLIQAVSHYCGTSPTGSNIKTGQIRRIIEVKQTRDRVRVTRATQPLVAKT